MSVVGLTKIAGFSDDDITHKSVFTFIWLVTITLGAAIEPEEVRVHDWFTLDSKGSYEDEAIHAIIHCLRIRTTRTVFMICMSLGPNLANE